MNFIDKTYIEGFMNEHGYPDVAKECFCSLIDTIAADVNKSKHLNRICNLYMYPKAHNKNKAISSLKKYSEEIGENEYSIILLFWMLCSKVLKERYRKKGYDEQIFFDSMHDMRYKLLECMDCEGVCGTFTGEWFHEFFSFNRFALGRFQYEKNHLANDYIMPNGRKFSKNSPCLGLHIPSSGVSLTDEVRIESYKKAYTFMKKYYKKDVMLIRCSSWLLYNRQHEFLPKTSNVLKFLDDFDLVSNREFEGFPSGWRLFGKDSDLPYDRLPEDFSLRKAYKDWLIKEGKTGDGQGIIVFDGEKIINRNK